MKNLVRGGWVLGITGLVLVFIFAQIETEPALAIANNSQTQITNYSENILEEVPQTELQQTDDKKLVKTTASVRAKGAGANRGAFSATAYCFSGRTAMGHGVRRGLIAADPRVLKLGSRVTINAGPWSGTYLVSDTGGAIKGKRIDIWVPSCSEARRFGRRNVQIFSTE
jgi:3D (Asp-Asp-Asp) domain-containing protein